jgi:pimeloyl-ACP methyl ester carboxylesterase
MKSKTLGKILVAIVAIASCTALVTTLSSQAEDVAPAAAQVHYPVLLVHGLGAASPADDFGNLEEYLGAFYFDVEVMDFNDYRKKKFAKGNDAGELSSLAAALNLKIDDMKKDYKTDKVNVVAHSYGGLIVHAYILGFAEEADKKNGAYDGDIDRVLFLQTPFYGSIADEDVLEDLAKGTDYDAFTDEKKIVRDLMPGSGWVYQLDLAMTGETPYEEDEGMVSAMFVSDKDEVVAPLDGILRDADWIDDEYEPYRIFRKYPHSGMSQPAAGVNDYSLAYVEEFGSENFQAIASFLDTGYKWLRMGNFQFLSYNNFMLKVMDEQGQNLFGEKDVYLVFKKAIKEKGNRIKKKIKVNDRVNGIFNEDSKVYYFRDVVPGTYDLVIKHPAKGELRAEYDLNPETRTSLRYNPADHEIVGGRGNLRGLLTFDEFTPSGSPTEPWGEFRVNGVEASNFFIEFEVTGLSPNQDRNVLFEILNADSLPEVRDNGSRIRIATRGNNGEVSGSGQHAGKIQLNVVTDKNRNGFSDDGEWFEAKTDLAWDWWTETHFFRLEVRTTVENYALYRVLVDGKEVFQEEKSNTAYNPAFIIYIGGLDLDGEEYFCPIGATFRNWRLGNIGQH